MRIRHRSDLDGRTVLANRNRIVTAGVGALDDERNRHIAALDWRRNRPAREVHVTISSKALALAAVVGAAAAIIAVRPISDRNGNTASDRAGARPAAVPAVVGTAPAPPRSAPALPRSELPLDDDALARHASEHYGFDCPRIVARGEKHAGYQDVTCGGGLELRVYDVDGSPPRIGPVH
jgi:hypothetical protein